MKAARIHHYGSADEFRVEEAPVPVPSPRDLLVEVHATSVNPVDWKIRAGTQRAVVRPTFPATLGMDVSGVVIGVGEKVTKFRVGDEVFASPRHNRPGTYAEVTVVDEREAAHKPSALSHAEAASIPLVGLTGWRCLVTTGRVRPGQRVFIQAGSGGVGTLTIQLAKHLGATVTTTCSPRNEALVRSLGADEVLDYGQQAWWEGVEQQDLVLDALAGPERDRLRSCTRRGGHLITINSELPHYGDVAGPYLGLGLSVAHLLRYALVSRILHGVRFALVVRRPDGNVLQELAGLLERGVIRPVIDRTYSLDEIAEAHRYGETGRARGKIVIEVGS